MSIGCRLAGREAQLTLQSSHKLTTGKMFHTATHTHAPVCAADTHCKNTVVTKATDEASGHIKGNSLMSAWNKQNKTFLVINNKPALLSFALLTGGKVLTLKKPASQPEAASFHYEYVLYFSKQFPGWDHFIT